MLERYKEIIDEALLKYLDSLPSYIYEPIKYIVNLGGKRFRSSLTLLAADLYGGDPALAIKEAMAVELFHNFTLVHDDIMDEATLRRGNKQFMKSGLLMTLFFQEIYCMHLLIRFNRI